MGFLTGSNLVHRDCNLRFWTFVRWAILIVPWKEGFQLKPTGFFTFWWLGQKHQQTDHLGQKWCPSPYSTAQPTVSLRSPRPTSFLGGFGFISHLGGLCTFSLYHRALQDKPIHSLKSAKSWVYDVRS